MFLSGLDLQYIKAAFGFAFQECGNFLSGKIVPMGSNESFHVHLSTAV